MITFEDSITVHYDGKGDKIARHLMDGAKVAKSMTAMVTVYNEAFKEANSIYKSAIESTVYVEGAVKGGSIKWLMKLFSTEAESQTELGASSSIHERVLSSIREVVLLIKEFDPSTTDLMIVEGTDSYQVSVNGRMVEVTDLACAILGNHKIRRALGDLADPLDDDELDTLTISTDNNLFRELKISSDDRMKFVTKKQHTKIVASGEFDGFYYIETLTYSPDGKWVLVNKDDPKDKVSGVITDTTFLKRVSENTERFAKDDILEIHGEWFKEKKKITGKPRTTYIITEVRDHKPAGNKQWELQY
ncbi:hypothetical protein KIV40_20280 [Vibrio sp. D173a]|uniref:hypothetical protein n=1 Tax=Vibrio sp. D173a TaxID=2836349 RepID=UPI0025560ADB|nr:hypothetical protein [Vibrio sp. D173a]MDK9757668.1 hypothetical protein [Vibrio sp. D173a]